MPSSLANKSGICVSQKYCSSFPDTGLVPRVAHITSNTESDLHWVWDSLVLELDSLWMRLGLGSFEPSSWFFSKAMKQNSEQKAKVRG